MRSLTILISNVALVAYAVDVQALQYQQCPYNQNYNCQPQAQCYQQPMPQAQCVQKVADYQTAWQPSCSQNFVAENVQHGGEACHTDLLIEKTQHQQYCAQPVQQQCCQQPQFVQQQQCQAQSGYQGYIANELAARTNGNGFYGEGLGGTVVTKTVRPLNQCQEQARVIDQTFVPPGQFYAAANCQAQQQVQVQPQFVQQQAYCQYQAPCDVRRFYATGSTGEEVTSEKPVGEELKKEDNKEETKKPLLGGL